MSHKLRAGDRVLYFKVPACRFLTNNIPADLPGTVVYIHLADHRWITHAIVLFDRPTQRAGWEGGSVAAVADVAAAVGEAFPASDVRLRSCCTRNLRYVGMRLNPATIFLGVQNGAQVQAR